MSCVGGFLQLNELCWWLLPLTTSFLNHFLFSVAHISHCSNIESSRNGLSFHVCIMSPSTLLLILCFYSLEHRRLERWIALLLPNGYLVSGCTG